MSAESHITPLAARIGIADSSDFEIPDPNSNREDFLFLLLRNIFEFVNVVVGDFLNFVQ